MGKGMPDPPDPWKTAQAQTAANDETAQRNFGYQNANEYTPYGSKTYSQEGWQDIYDQSGKVIGRSPRYSSNIQLSPAEQGILDRSNVFRTNMGDLSVSQSERAKALLSTNVNTQGLTDWSKGPQAATLQKTFGGNNPMVSKIGAQTLRQDQTPTDRSAVERAMMDRYERSAAPRNTAQETEMAARGLSPGAQGYSSMQDAQNRERLDAQTNSFLASGDESRAAQDAYNKVGLARFGMEGAQGAFQNQAQQQAFEQAQARAGFSNTALGQEFTMGGAASDRQNALRGMQWGERLQERNQAVNEMASFAGLAPVNTPNLQPYQGSTMNAPNIGQYIYDNYNARAMQAQNNMSGMFGIAGEVAGALPWASWLTGSDRRMKQDIEPLGGNIAGAPTYKFRYISDPATVHYGVMSDEVRELHPDAVTVVGGYDYVNYDLLYQRHTF